MDQRSVDDFKHLSASPPCAPKDVLDMCIHLLCVWLPFPHEQANTRGVGHVGWRAQGSCATVRNSFSLLSPMM